MKSFILNATLFVVSFSLFQFSQAQSCSDPLTKTGPYCDFDGDGINNMTDLDDDNDGILDSAEANTFITDISNLDGTWNALNGANTGGFAVGDVFYRSNVVSGPNGESYDFRLEVIDLNTNNTTMSGTALFNSKGNVKMFNGNPFYDEHVIYQLSFVRSGTLSNADEDGELVQSVVRAKVVISDLDKPGVTTVWSDIGGFLTTPDSTKLGADLSLYNYTPSSQQIAGLTDMTAPDYTDFDDTNHHYTGFFEQMAEIQLIHGVHGSHNGSTGNRGAGFEMQITLMGDADADGFPDYLDTDSDGDGCPDALEGGGDIELSELDANGMITGAVYNNGMSKQLDSANGQTVGTMYNPEVLSSECITIASILDHSTIFKDSSAAQNVLLNDHGVGLTVTKINGTSVSPSGTTITTGQSGSLTINDVGAYTYTPALGFTGTDIITYEVCDDHATAQCVDESIIIDVVSLNNPADTSGNITIGNGDKMITYGDPISINVISNDADPEWNSLSFSGLEDPASSGNYINNSTISTVPGTDVGNNAVADAGDLVITTNGDVQFIPANGFKGTVDIDYQVCDDHADQACSVETLQILVLDTFGSAQSSRDNKPFANGDFASTDLNTPVTGNYFANDGNTDSVDVLEVNDIQIDPSGAATTVITIATNEGGSVTLYKDGSYLYTPPTGFSGTDYAIYEICDTAQTVQCTQATINFLVAPVVRDYSDLPTAWGDRYARFMSGASNTASGTGAFWLGATLTADNASNQNADATGDASDNGLIIPSTLWEHTTNDYKVIVNGAQSGIQVHFKLYIDWDNNGSFEDSYTGSGTTSSPDTVTVAVSTPNGFSGNTVNYRLVAQTSASRLDDAVLNGGEIEDYQVVTSAPLPVDLISFEAQKVGRDVELMWKTASEINNSHFNVERSYEGVLFSSIGIVKGHGNSNQINSYTFIDKNVDHHKQNVMYRLRQVDFDGAQELSEVRIIQFEQNDFGAEVLEVFPNPSRGTFSIKVNALSLAQATTLKVLDIHGKTVLSKTLVKDDNQSTIQLELNNRVGIYYVVLQNITDKITKKLLLIH